MGVVCFQSRQDGTKLLEHLLLDQHNDEFLFSFLQGELVVLSLDLTEEQFGCLISEIYPGVRAIEKVPSPNNENSRHEVSLEFRVIERIHHILPDWINAQNGFRLSGTTIYLKAVSDQAEELFIELLGLKNLS